MLSGCELIDTENISLPSQNMKLVASRLIFFSINHQSSLNQYIYICIFAGKKSHDSKYSKYASPKHSS